MRGLFLAAVSGDYFLVAVWALLVAVASLIVEHRLWSTAWTSVVVGSVVVIQGLVALQHVESSQTRDWTCIIGWHILNYWTTQGSPLFFILAILIGMSYYNSLWLMMLNIFHVLICRRFIFFGEMSIHVFFPFPNWIFFHCWVLKFLCILHSPFSDMWIAPIFSQSIACAFILLTRSFPEQVFNKSNLSILPFVDHPVSVTSKISLLCSRLLY